MEVRSRSRIPLPSQKAMEPYIRKLQFNYSFEFDGGVPVSMVDFCKKRKRIIAIGQASAETKWGMKGTATVRPRGTM